MKKLKKPKSVGQTKIQNVRHETTQATAAKTVDKGRRAFLRKARNGAIALGVVGGGGIFLVRSVHGTIVEHDLTRVDNGRPTIVQIHDPQCTVCLSLQRQTRRALSHFDKKDVDYVVANIRTAEGQAFQALYGVPHVTLLLFDANGELFTMLQGQRQADDLRSAFERLVAS